MEPHTEGCSSKNSDDNFLGFEIITTPTGRNDRYIIPDYDCKVCSHFTFLGKCLYYLERSVLYLII